MPRLREDAIRGTRTDATYRAEQKGFDELSSNDQQALAALASAELF